MHKNGQARLSLSKLAWPQEAKEGIMSDHNSGRATTYE